MPARNKNAPAIRTAVTLREGRARNTVVMSTVSAQIVPNGDPVQVTISNTGDVADVTFTGNQGEQLGLGFTSGTFSCCVSAKLLDPANNQVSSQSFSSSADWNFPTLASSGTYTIHLDPEGKTGSVTLTLSDDLTGSVAVNGDPASVSIARAGQNERMSFSGTSGENVGLGWTGSSLPCCTTVTVKNPDGSTLTSAGLFDGSDMNFPTLPATGTYTLVVDPGTNTGSATVTLSDDVDGGVIQADVAPVTAAIDRIGQNERFTFEGAASEELNLGISENTFSSGILTILAPDASRLLSSGFSNSDTDLQLPTLNQSGVYTVILDPGVNTGSATLTLTDPPKPTDSYYMPSASLSAACQLGITAAQAGPSKSAIILDWGRPAYDGTDLGTYLLGTETFVSDGDILAATKEFVRCYYNNSSGSEQLVVGMGTNNYHLCPCGDLPPSYSSAGALWGSTVNDLGDYIQTNGYSSVVSAAAGDDAEPGWDTAYTTTGDFVDGYNSTASWIMLDYRSMESGYWSQPHEYHIAYGAGVNFPFPEIYCEGQQTDWENLAVWAAANEPPGMLFLGVLATYPFQIGNCTTFSPRAAYVKMLRALQSHSSTYQTNIGYLSNIHSP